ncbi:sensor histidine kinase [Shimazuella kribbensis]|uniref:sensor histidine kinase n=1 Tax=Shimazuella kribbensis TaxID=139808 RepID=UPI00041257A8|nr:ATP-binding protein [Shimazuella kribbensis]
MKKRLAWTFIAVASGMVGLASIIYLIEMHYHISLFQKKFPLPDPHITYYNYHFEQALIESTIWTAVGTILLAVCISFYIAKRMTAPMIEMRKIAEQMALGNWNSRVKVEGTDELAHLGQTLNHLTEQLQKHEVLRRNLTSDVAHELRTPLATLKSHMEAFEDGIWEPTPVRIHSCQEELERLIHLVGDLEQLTNLESPGFTLHKRKENLVEIIQQSVRTMETNFILKNVELVTQIPECVVVFADRNRIAQILINILSNSLKFTSSGGTVIVKVTEGDNDATILIRDTGIGIPDSEVSKIFERFYRVDKSRSRKLGGSGIGLTIVKKLVEEHKGSIRVESKVGKGTSVFISIPKKDL